MQSESWCCTKFLPVPTTYSIVEDKYEHYNEGMFQDTDSGALTVHQSKDGRRSLATAEC
jgi:hypothetical protein